MSTRLNIEDVTLVYGEDGDPTEQYRQNLSDVPESGTLIHPESGDDMEIVAVELSSSDLGEMPHRLTREDAAGVVTLVWHDSIGVSYFQDVTSLVEVGAAIDPDTGEDLTLSHVLLVEC